MKDSERIVLRQVIREADPLTYQPQHNAFYKKLRQAIRGGQELLIQSEKDKSALMRCIKALGKNDKDFVTWATPLTETEEDLAGFVEDVVLLITPGLAVGDVKAECRAIYSEREYDSAEYEPPGAQINAWEDCFILNPKTGRKRKMTTEFDEPDVKKIYGWLRRLIGIA